MKCRKQFQPLGESSLTPIYDAVSMTQPDMSLSIQEIVDRFAFVGDEPLGMMSYPEPRLSEDERIFEQVDLNNLPIQELEELSAQLMERAEWLRSRDPAATITAPEAQAPQEPIDKEPADK